MNVDFAFICDYAEISNKINALGIGFDTIYATTMPATHPSFFLVFQLRANTVECGEKNLNVVLIDEDGKEIIPKISGKFPIPKPSEGTASKARVAMQIGMVKFPKYGLYSIHAVVEGNDIIDIPLRVAPPPKSS